jgi:hypothetical protein
MSHRIEIARFEVSIARKCDARVLCNSAFLLAEKNVEKALRVENGWHNFPFF